MTKRFLSLLCIFLGVAGFCAIPFIVGVHDLLETFSQVGGLGVIVFVVNASGTVVIPAIGWWLIMRAEGLPVSLGVTLQTNFMGYPLNVLTPSMFLGGEPLKTFYLASRYQIPKRRVLATIMVAKYQELGGLMLSMLVGTALFIWHVDYLTPWFDILLITLLAVLVSLFGLTFYAFVRRGRPLVIFLTFLVRCRIFPRLFERLLTLAADLEDLIYQTLTNRPRVLLVSQAITCFSAITIFMRPWIFFRALPHFTIGFDQLCALFVITNLVNAFTIIPGGLGLFEATLVGYASLAQLGDDKGAALALISRIADLIFLIIGGCLIFHHGLEHIARSRDTAFVPADTSSPPMSAPPPHDGDEAPG